MHGFLSSASGKFSRCVLLVLFVVGANAAECGTPPGPWRLYVYSLQLRGTSADPVSLGGLVVAESGDAATVDPIGSMLFPCVFTVEPNDLRVIVEQLPGLLAEMRRSEDRTETFPPRTSSIGRRLYDDDSPYQRLEMTLQQGAESEERTRRFAMQHAGLEYAREAYPTVVRVAEHFRAINDEVDPNCRQSAFQGDQ